MGQVAPLDPPPPTPQVLARDVWLIPGAYLPDRQPDGNSLVFKGETGLTVFDTGRHRWHRQAILDLAASLNSPIAVIVNSHWHLDHVSGNPALRAAYPGVKVYASAAIDEALTGFLQDSAAGAREYLKSPRIPPETAADILGDLATVANGAELKPDVVVSVSTSLAPGGRRMDVKLSHDGPTAGDVWLYDPGSRIAAAGDLVTLPVPFLDTACVAGWRSALDQIGATPFEILVPGHGAPMTRAEFHQYRVAFNNFAACSGSDADPAGCAAGWLHDAGKLLETNGMDIERARAMAGYYIANVLRPNGGNSKYCKS